MSEAIKCTVKWYNAKKGFGFLNRDDSDEKDIFCHASSLREAGIRYLNEGQKLTCTLEESEKGPSAINLKLIDQFYFNKNCIGALNA